MHRQTIQWPKYKKDKMTNNDLQNIHRKLKIEQRKPHKNWGLGPRCSERISSTCSTSDSTSCYSSYKPSDKAWMLLIEWHSFRTWNLFTFTRDPWQNSHRKLRTQRKPPRIVIQIYGGKSNAACCLLISQ